MKHKPIPKRTRQLVYAKYDGHCAYCGCKLEPQDMQIDHAKSVFLSSYNSGEVVQDDSIENLMPACRQLHFNEQSPELMFQDYENIPESFITESSISVDGDGTTQFTTYQSIYDEVQECAEDLLGNEFTSLPKDMQDKFVDKLTAAVFDIVDWQMTSSYIYVDLDIDEEFEYFLSDNCSQ